LSTGKEGQTSFRQLVPLSGRYKLRFEDFRFEIGASCSP
jgi:hypothetical protein